MILPLGNDERLLLALRTEKKHVAFHRQTFDRRQREERVIGAARHQLLDLARRGFGPFDVQLDVAHSVLRTGVRTVGKVGARL
ncbi:hypothetical protein DP43_5070 [Burkholderia pseudomallei]|nr:hypothetical protein DP43_5070 [Burkholderia pseudomallei]